MIIKGKIRANGKQLGSYLLTPGENERINVVEVRGTISENVVGACEEMEAVAVCTKAQKPLYHASINTPASERMTEAQRLIAVDRLEKELGFEGLPRVIVVHEKFGREHTHIAWGRTDVEQGRIIGIDFNYRNHERVARELETQFEFQRVQGVHIGRDGQERACRTPKQWEVQQEGRTGIKIADVERDFTLAWQRSDCGKTFKAEIERQGYIFAAADRRDFVVIDRGGGIHSIPRRIEGVRAADVRARFSDLDRDGLPTAKEAKEVAREQAYLNRRELQTWAQEQDLSQPRAGSNAGMAAQQREAMDLMHTRHDRKEVTDSKREISDQQRELQQRREALLRAFGREVDHELDPSQQLGAQERTRR